MPDTLLARFLRYVKINTGSQHESATSPSTPGQWTLLRLLADELRAMGAADVSLDEYGYVLATIPGTSGKPGVPTVALLAHVDTSPDFNSEGVKPIVHKKWNGKPIVLPDDPRQVIDPARFPTLAVAKGQDIVT